MIITLDDFNGEISQVSGNKYTQAEFQTFITEDKEKAFIREIFGLDLGNMFLADLAGDPQVPQTPKWQLIFSFFTYEIGNVPVNCKGLKNALIGLFYNDYVSQQNIGNQITGNKSIRGEASTDEGQTGKSAVVYNRAVETITAIQYYVCQKPTDYPNFRGVQFELQSGF